MIALKTYKGEVPMSPYIIPSAINNPPAVTLLVFRATIIVIDGIILKEDYAKAM